MDNVNDLMAKRAEIDRQIQEAKRSQKAEVIRAVKQQIAQYELTAKDLFSGAKVKVGGAKVAPKYRNPATGETWTGRGKAPKWVQGQDKAKFLIQA